MNEKEIMTKQNFDEYRYMRREYALKVLAKTGKLKIPLGPKYVEKVENFLEGIEGCTWEYAETKRQKRQFETSLKTWFSEFDKELVLYHMTNPPIINGKGPPFKSGGLHTMDDQGFEGQIMSDGSFYRWINDLVIK